MNLPIVVYFSSILLTFLLTGALAWYAWRQPPLPGVRAYAWLVLSECLLALAEIFSTLSGTQAQALFWFQIRFIFTAAIPVLWLVFALEYSGRKHWISKRLTAGMLIVPVITQCLIWTNNLHGFWVKQDVTFRQSGPFWIAVTSTRIPSLWFIVHTFYSIVLLLAGTVLILLVAWQKRKGYQVQSLLLVTGALIALAMALIPIFNLLPQSEFNPFIPGIGASALFYAFAIFQFEFLKRHPAGENAVEKTAVNENEMRFLGILFIIFILFTTGIATVGYTTYKAYENQFRGQVENQLSAIAVLKADELQNWRNERMADANLFYQNDNFSERVSNYFNNPEDSEEERKLLAWMEKVKTSPEYNHVALFDAQGVEQISIPNTPEAVSSEMIEQITTSLELNEIIFLDFNRHPGLYNIHLSLLIPVFDEQDQPLGVLVMYIDPNVYLYPYIQRWPVPSESAETALVRRDGNYALYLNNLRFAENAALNLRIPLGNKDVSAVKAALGMEGIVQGVDYRGVEIISDVRTVPDSPWFLISKIDKSEAYAPLRERLWQTIIFFGISILATTMALALVWRQQQTSHYRLQVDMLNALRASEEKFRLAFDTSPDSVSIIRLADGVFVSVNKGFEQISGYTREEVIGKTTQELNAWKSTDDQQKVLNELREGREVRNYEAPFLSQKGEVYGLISAAIINLNGEPHVLNIIHDITERKQAEEALRENEARLRQALTAAKAGTWEWNLQTNENIWSEELWKVYGLEPHSCKPSYEAWLQTIHPDDRTAAAQAVGEAAQNGTELNAEWRVLERDGTERWVMSRGQPFRNAAGDVVRYVGTVLDITERKKAEKELLFKDELLHITSEMAKVGGWEFDPQTLQGTWTDEVARIHDLDPAQPTNVELGINFYVPDSRQKIEKAIEEAIGSAKAYDLELQMITASGNQKWVRTMGLPIQKDGKVVKVQGIFQDITERKLDEEKLAASEVRYRRLFETARDGILILNAATGMIEDANPFLVNLLGFSREVFIGKNIWEIGFFKDIAANKANFLELQQEEYIRYEDLPLETVDGRRVHVEFTSNLYHTDAYSVVQCNIRDITERKQAKEQLIKTLEELKRSNTELEQFAYVASHDLQEPLRTVAGMVQLLQQRYKDKLDENANEYINFAVDGAIRMQTLINDLLSYSRVERRGNSFQPIDTNEALKLALRNLGAAIAEQGADITSENLPTLEADSSQLIQLFQNLIGNAIKFHSELPLQIHIGVERSDDAWRFSVRDNGIGIEPKHFERIFLVFQRLHARRDYPGTGIGLSICKKIVERHGGRIWIESEPGQGTTFYFTIPHRRNP